MYIMSRPGPERMFAPWRKAKGPGRPVFTRICVQLLPQNPDAAISPNNSTFARMKRPFGRIFIKTHRIMKILPW
ncbi:hypothetical protein A4R26_11845 [Niastella populi]|uniref:Uncharacterized protein n=1 Tax=Niastella populi TaxID=550983 RepID=A0A1V9GAV1_9BACT|nr:hypothetical protein A4R26_11845 [Niastella populi]